MVLFVFIGRSKNRTDIVKKVAKKRAFTYTSTKDFSVNENISSKILKELNSGRSLFLNVENRANEIFNNSFINNLKPHFVIYFVLAAKNDNEADEFKDWPDYFVLKESQQKVEFISDIIGELIHLTMLFSKHKPFNENHKNVEIDNLLSINPIDAHSKIPISGLFYLMLTLIKSRTLNNTKFTLKQGINFLMHFNSVPTKTMPKGIPIYRVRFNDTCLNKPVLYEEVEKLWHPPKSKTSIGRFNRNEQPALYTADHILTCFYETYDFDKHGKEGFVTALGCLVNENITEGYISAMDVNIPAGKNIFYNHFLNFYNGKIIEQERLIKNFLGYYINSHKFFSPNFNYEITNLISDILYSDNQLQAIMYPSTKVNYQYNNIVFHETNAQKYIIPQIAIVYSYSFPKPLQVSLKPIYKGKVIGEKIKYEPVN